MSATCVFTELNYPQGRDEGLIAKEYLRGNIAIGNGTYVTNGLPITFSPGLSGSVPFFGSIYSETSGFQFSFDHVNQTVRIFQQTGATGALVELGNGVGIPAGVSGDATILAEFVHTRT